MNETSQILGKTQVQLFNMHPTPAQTIDVVLHTDPTPWWQILAALGPIVVILIIEMALIVLLVLRGFRGRHGGFQAGLGSEVDWEQLEWALNSSVSSDPRRARIGQHAIHNLSRLRLKKEDRELLNSLPETPHRSRQGEPRNRRKMT